MKIQISPSPAGISLGRSGQSIQPQKSFRAHLQDALQQVNTLQKESDIAFERLLAGDIEFHDAMIVAEKANLALQLTMAIRTKLLEAYQEIMRMQV